jgi:hypothetical protein
MMLKKFDVNGNSVLYFEIFGVYVFMGRAGDALSVMCEKMPTGVKHNVRMDVGE